MGWAWALFALGFAATRVGAAGSLVGALALVGATVALGRPRPVVVLAATVTSLVIALHHDNIRRILKGEEHTLDDPPP